MVESKDRPRLYLLDLVRLFAMGCIVAYHSHSSIFINMPDFPYSAIQSFYKLFVPTARFFSFSGQLIIALSATLLGFSKKRVPLRILVYATIGILFLGFTQDNGKFLWEWDVYHYIVVMLFTFVPFYGRDRSIRVLGLVGLVLMTQEFWLNPILQGLPVLWQHILIGYCENDSGKGGWSLLPWIGLAWLHFAIGFLARENMGALAKWRKWEYVMWPVLGTASIPNLGAYYNVPLDNGFYCFIYRRSLLEFWSHWVWILFLIRASFLPVVQRRIETSPNLMGLCRLHWNRYFGLCYLISLGYFRFGSIWADQIRNLPRVFDFFFVGVPFFTELSARLLLRLKTVLLK